MPSLPYIITGTVKDSRNNILDGIQVILTDKTKNSNPLYVLTDENGIYTADAANFNIEYGQGDTILIIATNSFQDETKTDSFTISGISKTLNLTLEVISL